MEVLTLPRSSILFTFLRHLIYPETKPNPISRHQIRNCINMSSSFYFPRMQSMIEYAPSKQQILFCKRARSLPTSLSFYQTSYFDNIEVILISAFWTFDSICFWGYLSLGHPRPVSIIVHVLEIAIALASLSFHVYGYLRVGYSCIGYSKSFLRLGYLLNHSSWVTEATHDMMSNSDNFDEPISTLILRTYMRWYDDTVVYYFMS